MLAPRAIVSATEEQQRKIKGELLIEATTAMGMDALGVGETDLAFGIGWLRKMAAKHKAPYVSANLRDPDNKLVFPATRLVTKGDYTIGITSVLMDTFGLNAGSIDDPATTLRAAVAELKAQDVDLVVALVHAQFDVAQTLAKDVPGIDLMFTGHSKRHQEDPILVGDTALLEAGSRSKYVGEARLTLKEGATGWSDPGGRARLIRQKEQLDKQVERYEAQLASADEKSRARIERVLEFSTKKRDALVIPPEDDGTGNGLKGRRVPLSRDIADDEAMTKLVDSYLLLLGPDAGRTDPHAGHDHAVPTPTITMREDYGDWVTARTCMGCHKEQHADWMKTPHARAWATLVKEKRQYDLDCWACHVTGAGKAGGPAGPGEVGPLKNVQCEACHGPGKAHSAQPAKSNIVKSPDEALCVECHSEEQTMGRFVHDEYLPKVDHKD